MQKLNRTITWTVLASEVSHVFCCLIPAALSLLSLFSSAGLVGMVPGFVLSWHEIMHNWEPEMIAFSGILLLTGWSLHRYSKKQGCTPHQGACKHEICEKRRRRTDFILLGAALLFTVNVTLYLGVHKDAALPHAHESHDGHNHTSSAAHI